MGERRPAREEQGEAPEGQEFRQPAERAQGQAQEQKQEQEQKQKKQLVRPQGQAQQWQAQQRQAPGRGRAERLSEVALPALALAAA
jgi:hypothetical protein